MAAYSQQYGGFEMGYTHYWKTGTEFTAEQWKQVMKLTREIIQLSSVDVHKEYDDPEAPVITKTLIRFNGVDEDGHETFWVEPGKVDFAFCKTARKPYDEIVVACLMMMEDINRGFSWSSDGDAEDHREGLALYNAVMEAAGIHSDDLLAEDGDIEWLKDVAAGSENNILSVGRAMRLANTLDKFTNT
jgi:hypothetical protein